jgi:hypothetical protein
LQQLAALKKTALETHSIKITTLEKRVAARRSETLDVVASEFCVDEMSVPEYTTGLHDTEPGYRTLAIAEIKW